MDAREIDELLDGRPDLRSPLEAVLEVDDRRETWTFDDVPVDSGAFGELVSRELIERADDGYRLEDPAAVRAALYGEPDPGTGTGVADRIARFTPSVTVPRGAVGAILGVLAVLVGLRLLGFQAVFRNGDVVLASNDPYYYRYWVERLLGITAESVGGVSLGELPGTVARGEPLLIVLLWWLASGLGGGPDAAGLVLAWYPVVAGALTGLLVYGTATVVSRDRRVGLAAMAMLAVLPAHAFRTSVGFADHHAFDYLWLALIAFAVTYLAHPARRAPAERGALAYVVAVGGLGLGIAGQTLAWQGSPVVLAPLGLYLLGRSLLDLERDVPPLVASRWVLAGMTIGAVLTVLVHATLGWHRAAVALAPVFLTGGGAAALGLAELFRRFDRSARSLLGTYLVGGGAAAILVRGALPEVWAELRSGVGFLLTTEGVVEAGSLYAVSTLGWFVLFGLLLVFAVPYLLLVSRRVYRTLDPAWLAVAVYGWYFVFLAGLQQRFSGELSVFVAVIAGAGFVHVAVWLDVLDPPTPFERPEGDRPLPAVLPDLSWPTPSGAGRLAVLFLLIAGVSLLQVPVKIEQATTDGDAYRTAVWMESHAADRGWSYPESYVLSRWETNRMYNYFVNGRSESYGFARQTYREFLASVGRSTAWYQRLRDQVGFVVTQDAAIADPDTMQTRLHTALGSRQTDPAVPGLSHYRAVYVAPDGSPKVFTLVPGATIRGTGPPGTVLEVRTEVAIDGARFTYERRVRTDSDGQYAVRVPYPGTYTIGETTVRVPESAVLTGALISVEEA